MSVSLTRTKHPSRTRGAVTVAQLGERLAAIIPSIIAVPFDPEGSEHHLDAVAREVMARASHTTTGVLLTEPTSGRAGASMRETSAPPLSPVKQLVVTTHDIAHSKSGMAFTEI